MDAKKIMQSQNFEFLRARWPELASLGGFAEQYVNGDPESALVKLRAFAERMVAIVYQDLALPRHPMSVFMDLLSNDTFKTVTPTVVINKLHAIRIHGNKAAHGDKISVDSSLWLVREAWDLGRWLFVTFGDGTAESVPEFSPLAPPPSAKNEYKKARKALLEQYAKQEARMQAMLAELEAERQKVTLLEKTAGELSFAQGRAQRIANELHFNEASTRKRLIDLQLTEQGWDIGAESAGSETVTLEEEILHQPTQTGKGYADYVLWDDNGQPLAVIEAKKSAVDAEKGRHQARHYADGLERMHGQRPIIFYTNGHDIWIWDDHPAQNYPPRRLYGFYSKTSLQYLVRQRRERESLNTVSPRPDILGDRLYQHEALKRVCERFEERHRKALAVQATGTGKTRLAIAISHVAMQAGWVKRVLFLCDRRELRKQAKNAFSEFLSAPVTVLTSKSVSDDANSIFLATYPAMDKIYQRFDPGFFDLIIADESHRSIYNVYGDLFRYFDALLLGLTATPVEMVSRSTCRLFGCDFKLPTANYSLDRAVEEGYLVPYEVVKHTTKFLREGIKGHALTAEELAQLEDQGIDPNTLDFEGGEIDRAIYNKDTNRKILQNLMENGIRQADCQTLGKTIVFARNHRHAKVLEELFNEMYPQYGGKFCQVIDNYDPRAEALIDDFKGQGSNDRLTVAISVDMLDTGIDVPEIVNLVFARPVKSPIKFWQMVGRGTRLCKNLFGLDKHKSRFQIFDHWGVVEYHGMQQREVVVSQSKSLMQRLFEARLELAKVSLSKGEVDHFDILAKWLTTAINSLNEKTIAVREKWKLKRQVGELEVIRQFAANTVTLLETDIAPLMQWVDIRGHVDAYRWDLLVSLLQRARLENSIRYEDLKGDVLNLLSSLQMNLNQVKAKAVEIKHARDPQFWGKASIEEVEAMREALRDIIRYRNKDNGPDYDPPLIDIQDSGEVREQQRTHLAAVDMRAYRAKVEQALTNLFDTDPILQKIRTGLSVTEQELESLNALIHIQNPGIDLRRLHEFYGSAAPLDQVLRSIVGMDVEAVNDRFARFIQVYPGLTAKQVQFLGMLKRQIAQSGVMELKSLYEMPFAAVGDLDQLFANEKQIEQIIAIVQSFGPVPQADSGATQ
jgi:type I restriction enzyme R subunit